MRLTRRQINEKKFHNKLATNINIEEVSVEETFSTGAQENRLAERIFGSLKNKRILDLGCGYGDTAVYWATLGAEVYAVDISEEMVKLARKLAQRYNVSARCHFRAITAEKPLYSKDYFDFVFGNSVLHHVDIYQAAKEVRRVLKKDGLAVFIEPLSYNPAINLYRKMADKVRTQDETPITFKEVGKLRTLFSTLRHQEFHFTTLAIFVWFFLVLRIHPNEERYWKKILQLKGGLLIMLRILIEFDKIILTLIPPLRYLCWNTMIILKK